MKLRLPLTILAAMLVLNGCGGMTESAGGYGYFRFGVAVGGPNRSILPVPTGPSGTYRPVARAVLTIVDEHDEPVNDSGIKELFDFNGSYISEPIRLPVGRYNLIKYLVADSDNAIQFAAPFFGSDLAGQVTAPLPLQITVEAGRTTNIFPDVLAVGTHTAGEFGYIGMEFPGAEAVAHPSWTLTMIYTLGPNGVAFDGDDRCETYRIQEYRSYYDNVGMKTFHTVDGKIDNGDDTVNGWWMVGPGPNQGSWRNGPGPDNAWFTSDDVIEHTESWGTFIEDYDYQVISADPGPDGAWFTADDVETGHFIVRFDANGNCLAREFWDGAGEESRPGMTWFGFYYVNTWESGANRLDSWTRQDRFDNTGAPTAYVIHEFKDKRFPKFYTKEIVYNPQGQVTGYSVAVNYE